MNRIYVKYFFYVFFGGVFVDYWFGELVYYFVDGWYNVCYFVFGDEVVVIDVV